MRAVAVGLLASVLIVVLGVAPGPASDASMAASTATGKSSRELLSVSCTAGKVCTAVGDQSSTGQEVTLAERWNGTNWAIQPTANPIRTSNLKLLGVSCVASKQCMAVGDYVNSTGQLVTLAEGWNGTSWAVQPTQEPTGAVASELSGVSCAAATACMAVGDYSTTSDRSSTLPLAEQWNGTSWAILPTPKPRQASYSILNGV